MIKPLVTRFLFLVLKTNLVIICAAAIASAQGAGSDRSTNDNGETTQLQTLRVTGMQAEELSQPTAPKRITKEALEDARTTDIGRALRQAPGVYVRDEEGQGLRPNIGLRGTNPDRSKKIVLMQDEILVGPAPYSAPAAYFTPALNLAEELQVYKGFAAVLYGPNSIGGAINSSTRQVPTKLQSNIDFGYGSFGSSNLRILSGNSTSWGGYVLEGVRVASDGFKKLDGGGPTGFERSDFSGKLKFDLPSVNDQLQFIEVRLGYGQELSNETYLGLSSDDFQLNPYRRYAASAKDQMKWAQTKVQLEYNRQIGEAGLMRLSLYRHDFHRDWNRLDRFGLDGKTIKSVLQNPTGIDAAYAGILNGSVDSSSQGGTDGQLVVAGNDRKYISQGLQMIWTGDVPGEVVSHQFKVIARLHQDQIDRTHTFDNYQMTSGQMNLVNADNVAALNQDWALASTLGLQDDITMGPYVLTLMGRAENIQFRYRNKVLGTQNQRGDSFFVPGVGLLRKMSETISVKASVNQAVTAAGLDSGGTEKREESLNTEFGLKYLSESRTTEADLVVFENAYSNITGICSSSTGCATSQLDQQFNGGKARIRGVEARLGHSVQALGAWFPVQLNLTLLEAQFANSFNLPNETEWGKGLVESGDPLPYVPQVQYTLVLGHEVGRFKQALNFQYQGLMYDQSVQAGREVIPAFGVIDWNALYNISDTWQVFAKADNITGRKYMVALRPFGARPGKPQSMMLGLKASF